MADCPISPLLITGIRLDDAPRRVHNARTELVQRLLADRCELCGSTERVAVHHIRRLKDLERPGRPNPPAWVQKMAARRRKTLVVCAACHVAIHAGRVDGNQHAKHGHRRAG